ncbi:MAG: bifunctional precorrin-2 dehydrogenase/sirohydrochlorin ferrochelatase [Thermoproteota archaeon]|nr:bifunctional precorrin-2 dehydrogenase/sirohydrochlorin ferrochelatase [Thermoproteota archaeon]
MIVDLNLKDRIVLVIGAGLEGTKRIANLSKEDCQIIVLSDRVSEEFYEIEGSTYPIILIRRRIKDVDFLHTFNKVFLILAATNDSFLNNAIVEEAKKRNILSYSIDAPASGDLSFTSTINIKETIQISISTGGRSPLMSKIIKDKVENTIKNIIGQTDIDNIRIQEFARGEVKKYIKNQQERRKFLYSLVKDQEIQELISKKNIDKVKERIIKILDKWEDNKIG